MDSLGAQWAFAVSPVSPDLPGIPGALINRLSSISSTTSGSAVASSAYQYNSANQRVRNTQGDGSYWQYEYDALGQVRAGRNFWSDGTPVAGQQFEYTHDDIGNRRNAKAGGDQNGTNLRSASYTPNPLNQYTSRTVPGAVDVMGISISTNATVNTQTPYRKGEYFRKELTAVNTSGPVWQSVDVTAPSENQVSGKVFVPQTPETFGYDPDGNMTNDGRYVYTWDPENRLVAVQSLAAGPTLSKRKVTWEFDGKGRRIRQSTYDGSTGSYVLTEDLKFVSDGWPHIAELNAANNNLVRSYLWGLDLSGSLDGAGAVGGLLLVNSTANGAHFTCYDGNGNVAALVSAQSGTPTARYEYGPFGEPFRITGAMARENPFRFSTKRANDTMDLVLYEYRAYSVSTGRWLGRDPREEEQGASLYAFVGNSPLARSDFLGLATLDPARRQIIVGRCEIAILYGHGYGGKNHWKWRVTASGCGAGAAILCDPKTNTDGLSADSNLWSSWGGEELEDWQVMWGLPANGPDWSKYGHRSNAMKVLITTIINARLRARAMCSECGCCSVKVNFFQIDKNDQRVEPSTYDKGVPGMADFAIRCR